MTWSSSCAKPPLFRCVLSLNLSISLFLLSHPMSQANVPLGRVFLAYSSDAAVDDAQVAE
jgi:hypothetical protein